MYCTHIPMHKPVTYVCVLLSRSLLRTELYVHTTLIAHCCPSHIPPITPHTHTHTPHNTHIHTHPIKHTHTHHTHPITHTHHTHTPHHTTHITPITPCTHTHTPKHTHTPHTHTTHTHTHTHTQGLKATLTSLDTEAPRGERSISNRGALAKAVSVERLMRRNKV